MFKFKIGAQVKNKYRNISELKINFLLMNYVYSLCIY